MREKLLLTMSWGSPHTLKELLSEQTKSYAKSGFHWVPAKYEAYYKARPTLIGGACEAGLPQTNRGFAVSLGPRAAATDGWRHLQV